MKRIKYISTWDTPVDIVQQLENEHEAISEVIFDSTWETIFTVIHRYPNTKGVEQIIAVCEKHDIPITILTMSSDYNPTMFDWNSHPSIRNVNYTPWYIPKTFEILTRPEYLNYNSKKGCDVLDNNTCIDTPVEHLYISLNNKARRHRCTMMDILAKHELIDLGVISWRDMLPNYNKIRKNLDKNIPESVMNGFQYKYWKPKRMYLDFGATNVMHLAEQEFLPSQYASTFMQLVTESGDFAFFFTEKITMPLLFNKPFLIAGCKGYHKNLVDMGFQLYDELVDYSFDTEEDFEQRAEGIALNIARYRNHSMEELQTLKESVRPKLLHNRLLALEYVFDRIPQELKDMVSTLEEQNISTYLSLINKIQEFKNQIK
jgi:hypothetical protein